MHAIQASALPGKFAAAALVPSTSCSGFQRQCTCQKTALCLSDTAHTFSQQVPHCLCLLGHAVHIVHRSTPDSIVDVVQGCRGHRQYQSFQEASGAARANPQKRHQVCCNLQELVAEAGIPPHHMVSSLQDLYDANYPYTAAPWALQDIGHKAPSAWRAIAALAVRAPQHLPAAIRDKVSPQCHVFWAGLHLAASSC